MLHLWRDQAFSRVDLITTIVVIALLGCWFVFAHTGERGRVARCAANLAVLGEAMQSYTNDHKDGLPAAGINFEHTRISWDITLFPCLKPNLANATRSDSDKRGLLKAMRPWFFCPSDPIKRRNPRSYAMAARDMTYGWPPRSDDETGVGLLWDPKTIALLGKDGSNENPESLPELKLSVLPDPARTLLLTELIQSNNTLGSVSSGMKESGFPVPTHASNIRVWGPDQQRAVFQENPSFQGRKFNYLMADGHVELLSSLQAGASSDDIWTIKAGD